MDSAARRRRLRRTGLLLSAILVPTAVLVLLGVRVIRQERELADRRAVEARREALEQVRRELSARLQALRLEQVNRLIGETGTRLPPDSPIVFVVPMAQDTMRYPWDAVGVQARPGEAFMQRLRSGEEAEFSGAPAAARAVYLQGLADGPTLVERCTAWLALGRLSANEGRAADADRIDRRSLQDCGDTLDEDGVPLALYAASRLLDQPHHETAVAAYVTRRLERQRWHAPSEAHLLRSLLGRLSPSVARRPLERIARELRDITQVQALARDLQQHPGRLLRAQRTAPGDLPWLGYGDDPWLVTVVSPASFATPVLMVVSSSRVLPAGTTLHVEPSPGAVPMGDGFVNLHVSWPPGRFAVATATPPVMYVALVAVVLGAVLLAASLLLRDVHREAETALLRSHFVASVSHELRTPLTSIRAHAETLLLGRTPGAGTTTEYLKTIVSESERLGRLVDSVLEFSRIEQGRRSYREAPTGLADVVRAAARVMEYPLAQLGFTLTVSSDGSTPSLIGDAEALTQALLNLLSNAMKFSGDARRIDVRMGTRGREAFVDVTDYGIGIDAAEHAHIFERFHRVQSPATAGIAGAGLGLALARHVVEAHRGRISVVSDVGRGSTFSVRLPIMERA